MASNKVEFARDCYVAPMNAWQKEKMKPKKPELRIQLLRKRYQSQLPPNEERKCHSSLARSNPKPSASASASLECKCRGKNRLGAIWYKIHSYKVMSSAPKDIDHAKASSGMSVADNALHDRSHYKLSRFGAEALAAQKSRMLTSSL